MVLEDEDLGVKPTTARSGLRAGEETMRKPSPGRGVLTLKEGERLDDAGGDTEVFGRPPSRGVRGYPRGKARTSPKRATGSGHVPGVSTERCTGAE